MQRYFAITDPTVPVEYPAEHRLTGHSDATKAIVIDTLQRCLQRDPPLRASIPELLQHDFLADTQRITRHAFDRAMEALVAGFYAAASDTAAASEVDDVPDATAAEDQDADLPHCEAWQLIADDVWGRLAQEAEGVNAEKILPFQPLTNAGVGVPQSVAHFRSWLCRSEKRRRTASWGDASSTFIQEESAVDDGVHSASPSHQPTPTLPAGSTAARTPLAPAFGAVAVNGATAVDACLLQQQKSGLKKAALRHPASALKENFVPSRRETTSRRLRRRALAGEEEEPTHEMSQVTCWAVSSCA